MLDVVLGYALAIAVLAAVGCAAAWPARVLAERLNAPSFWRVTTPLLVALVAIAAAEVALMVVDQARKEAATRSVVPPIPEPQGASSVR
jgi:hypothetical protein